MVVDALVTGAGGFLGRYIVERLLSRGDRVKALGRKQYPDLQARGVEIVCADLCDRDLVVDACRSVDMVFHVAGIAGLGGRWKDFYRINTQGTRWVIEGCRRHKVGRLVYTSSPSVIFDGNDQCGVDESVSYPRRWLCHYAHSKALAEQEVLSANGGDGLLTCVLRPHLMWGPRDRSLIPRVMDRARCGRLIRVGDGTNRIDITYVENAADAHIQAADVLKPGSAAAGKAYFISQGEPVNCWDWINKQLAFAGLHPVRRSVSFATAWKLGACFEAIYRVFGLQGDPPMTRFLAAQMARSHYFSIARAKADFGYSPAVSTAEGMRRTAEWSR
ncbi:MAG: NAD-dependent epimerase/dehydratase family protein [Thermoguttaceae bacterium]|jgi:nucleoside-diphosphate-sugar epimerase